MSDPFKEYREHKKFDDMPFDGPDDVDIDEDVLVEQDNEFIADRWADAEDYEWET